MNNLNWISGTVRQKLDAANGKSPGKIILTNGQILLAFPEKLRGVQEGADYGFGCEDGEFRGAITHTVRAIKERSANETQSNRAAQAQTSLLRGGTEIRNMQGPNPKAVPIKENGYYKPTAPKDAKRMWMCSQLNAMISTHQVVLTTEGIVAANVMLSEAYDATLGQDDQ